MWRYISSAIAATLPFPFSAMNLSQAFSAAVSYTHLGAVSAAAIQILLRHIDQKVVGVGEAVFWRGSTVCLLYTSAA